MTYFEASFLTLFNLSSWLVHKTRRFSHLTMQLPNSELGIGTATKLCLIENSDELEGTSKEENFFCSVRSFYIECVKKYSISFHLLILR